MEFEAEGVGEDVPTLDVIITGEVLASFFSLIYIYD